MAIKGKGKTRSKPPARAPRPQPVQRKPPFFRRTGVLSVLSVALGAGLVWTGVWLTNGLRADDRASAQASTHASARKVVLQWATTVDGTLSAFQDPQPQSAPGPQQVVVFTSLSSAVATLAKGDPVKDAAATAKTAKQQADTAVGALSGVDLASVISGHGVDLATTNYLLNSKSKMVEGLQLYAQVADLVGQSAAAGDDAQAKALITEANTLLPMATQLFNEGYSDYAQAKASVSTPQELAAQITGGS
jgi:hypothetical protein